MSLFPRGAKGDYGPEAGARAPALPGNDDAIEPGRRAGNRDRIRTMNPPELSSAPDPVPTRPKRPPAGAPVAARRHIWCA